MVNATYPLPAGAPEDAWGNSTYLHTGSPKSMLALIDPGAVELRYFSNQTATILGRASMVLTKNTATLQAEAKTVAGAEVTVTWTGPANEGDFIAIVPAGWPGGAWPPSSNRATVRASPLRVTAPIDPGAYEVIYATGQQLGVLQRRLLTVTWTGPANQGDLIAIVPAGWPDGQWPQSGNRTRARMSPATVQAPQEPGDYEVIYIAVQGLRVLERRPLRLAPHAE